MYSDVVASIKGKRILYCVLNWGLGHASRSIPLIGQLNKANDVVLASDGEAGILLQKEFANLAYNELPSYGIHYKYSSMHLNMLVQFPKIMSCYNQEKRKIVSIVKDEGYDLVISDHRYGCRHDSVRSVFLGHQIQILGSMTGTKVNKYLIDKFQECWIPDFSDRRLSGELSIAKLESPCRFIGPLSRMKELEVEKEYDITAVLSGPEPKRTQLEAKIISQLEKMKLKVCLVRGTKEGKPIHSSRCEIKDLLDSKTLNRIMSSSRMIICRSGYSSLMDLEILNKPALIIPTKGQREQEYLAKNYGSKKNVIVQSAKVLDINKAYELLFDSNQG